MGIGPATWLELFYDLAFVVAIAVLGARLLADTSWTGLWSFFGYFALLWWLWASNTFYADRYDTDDLIYRLWSAAQMVAILVITASLAEGPSASTTVFAVGYASARLVLLALDYRVYRHVAETRSLVSGYLIGFGAAAVVWTGIGPRTGSGPLTPFGGWPAPSISPHRGWYRRQQAADSASRPVTSPRALRAVVILVLGESLAAVVSGLSHIGWSSSSLIATILGVLLATLLWWLYFDNAEGSVVRRRNIEGQDVAPDGLDLHPSTASGIAGDRRSRTRPGHSQCG